MQGAVYQYLDNHLSDSHSNNPYGAEPGLVAAIAFCKGLASYSCSSNLRLTA